MVLNLKLSIGQLGGIIKITEKSSKINLMHVASFRKMLGTGQHSCKFIKSSSHLEVHSMQICADGMVANLAARIGALKFHSVIFYAENALAVDNLACYNFFKNNWGGDAISQTYFVVFQLSYILTSLPKLKRIMHVTW